MSFRVPKNILPNVEASTTDINRNFAAIESELSALGTEGAIPTGFITTDLFPDGEISLVKLNCTINTLSSGASNSTIPTSQAVVDYVNF